MAEPKYTKSSAQLDAEARAKKDWQPSSVVVPGSTEPLSDDGFIGVDPIYRNFADPKFAPVKVEKGVEQPLYDRQLADDADFEKGAAPEGESEASEQAEDDKKQEPNGSQGSVPTPPAPPSA